MHFIKLMPLDKPFEIAISISIFNIWFNWKKCESFLSVKSFFNRKDYYKSIQRILFPQINQKNQFDNKNYREYSIPFCYFYLPVSLPIFLLNNERPF